MTPSLPKFIAPQDTLLFAGGRHEFDKADIAFIQQRMQQCKYGAAWDLAAPQNNWSIRLNPKRVTIQNYISSDGNALHGECAALSFKLGRQLEAAFEGKYCFRVVEGNYKKSGWGGHFFLLGWPKRINSRISETLANQWNSEVIPADCTVIDPTTRFIGNPKKKGYFLFHPVPSHAFKTDITLPNDCKIGVWEDKTTHDFCLGRLRDLDPKHPQPNVFAFLRFFKVKDAPRPLFDVVLFSRKTGERAMDWRKEFSEGSLVYTALEKMEIQLQSAGMNCFA